MRLKIASRKSDLARIQAYAVGEALQKAHQGLEIEYLFRESLGDKNLTDPLWKMPEKGVFTEDFYQDLVQNKVDLVVHSWKDLPVEEKPDTKIAATLKRADSRDLLFLKKSSRARIANSKLNLFSSSPRRAYNLRSFFLDYLPHAPKEVEFHSVRGNIPTRVNKLLADESIDGLILAKAAVDRILSTDKLEFSEARHVLRNALVECDFMVLPLSLNPTAAAQGALAIEVSRARAEIEALLKPIHDGATFQAAQKERETLSRHGGGCHQKIGVSVVTKENCTAFILRGETTEGTILETQTLLSPGLEGMPAPEADVWNAGSTQFFRREKMPTEELSAVDAVLVSHPEAYTGQNLSGKIIWSAGLSTWKKLAAAGIWVNGTDDGLGETDGSDLSAFFSGLRWAKLSHEGAPSVGKKLFATYRLVPLDHPVPTHHSAYFWRSASIFELALGRQPELKDKKHYTGPGHSYKKISAQVKVHCLWPMPKTKESS